MAITSVRPGTVISQWAEFDVTIQNVGDKDTILNLGSMLANGKVHWPTALLLSLTDAKGNTRELQFFDKRHPAIIGRLDDMTVSLPRGAAYILRLSLEHYCSLNTKDFALRLAPGRYQITARFEGKGADHVNLDMAGIALMNFWKGTLRSSVLDFEVTEKPNSK
jgi:hypothetical protein